MGVLSVLWSLFLFLSTLLGALSLSTFLVALVVRQLAMLFPQNLKRRYAAEWAVVTGASSGIGKAISEKLAQQNINVALVALDDPLLEAAFTELQQKYPMCRFRKVGVNLGEERMSYMAPIVEATKDIDVGLLFNNAGYICTGLFTDTRLEQLRANVECNAGCSIPLTQHFVRKMVEKRRPGLVTFTSSSAAYAPGPTATMYSPTKAFLTNFAMTLAAEVRDAGIHVVAIHPSPVNTNFYKCHGPALSSLKTAQTMAIAPKVIADQIFAAAGRLTIWDQGAVCLGFRLLNKLIDFPILAELIVRFAHLNADFKELVKSSKTLSSKKN